MKARVIETGEIEEFQVNELNDYFTKDGIHYKGLELDFDYEPDYWEKLKHQYAGMAMQGILSNKEMFNTITDGVWPPNRPAYIATKCDEYATALANRLKEDKS